MTKKDYIIIAEAINKEAKRINASPNGNGQNSRTILNIIDNLGWVLKKDNPFFDNIKFEEACLKD
jgi:hypothetical protein